MSNLPELCTIVTSPDKDIMFVNLDSNICFPLSEVDSGLCFRKINNNLIVEDK